MIDSVICTFQIILQGLSSLHQELQVLDALVYELFMEEMSLADLEKKSPLEKCKLLMSKVSNCHSSCLYVNSRNIHDHIFI